MTQSEPSVELLQLARELGFPGEIVGTSGRVRWSDVLAVGTSSVGLSVEVAIKGHDLLVAVQCPVLAVDSVRVGACVVAPPLRSFVNSHDGTNVLVRGAAPRRAGAPGLRRSIDAAHAFLTDLSRRGLIRIVSAQNDLLVAQGKARIAGLKVQDPKDALALATQLSRHCRERGDYWSAAEFDLDAADVAVQLGETSRSRTLADAAWRVLGEPVTNVDAVVAYANALGASGSCTEALDVFARAERVGRGPTELWILRLHRAIILGVCGQVHEAIPVLEVLASDPSASIQLRDHARRVLGEVRRLRGGNDAVEPREHEPFLVRMDRILNHASATLTATQTQPEIERRAPAIASELAEVRAGWDRLGLGQQVRLLMAEGGLAYYLGDMATATTKIRAAAAGAERSGDRTLINGAQVLLGWLPETGGSKAAPPHIPPNATPVEHMVASLDYAFNAIRTADAQGSGAARAHQVLPDIFAAVRAIDGTRHQFRSTEDRRAFALLGRRPYTIAAGVAGGLGRSPLFVEVLERMRAQGMPAGGLAQRRDDGFEPQSTEQALGDLVVGRPQFATLSGRSEIEPGRATVPLQDVVAAVAGPTAWWWTCQVIGDGIAWAVRSPSGQLVIDIVPLPDGSLDRLGQMVAWFQSPTIDAELTGHPLVDDRDALLDGLLRGLADIVLPRPLADAARAGAAAGAPIRLVWAPPPELGNVPVGLLPLDRQYRLLHGAAITVAPPTSLVTSVGRAQPRTGPIRETVVLGHDPRLSHAYNMVGAQGLHVPAARVTGTPDHVGGAQPLARAIATPDVVLRLWREPSPSLALYYGHVDPGKGSPLAASLRLSDPNSGRSAPLEVRALLTPERRGAPEAVVLCGCSSIEPTSVGTGEWWGFAVALLWQGSRQVLGSQWDLLDSEGTAAFTVELVARLCSGTNPSLALHALQLEWLAAWEGDRHRAFSGTAQDRQPILWSGWVATGMYGS